VSHFSALASLTSLDIVLNVRLDPGPPVVVRNEFLSLVTTRVSSRDAVMVQLDDLFVKSSAAWHINAMFPGNEFTVVVLVLFFIGESFYNRGVLSIIVFLDLSEDVFIKPLNVKAVDAEVFWLQKDDV